jgi:hypothetical protein
MAWKRFVTAAAVPVRSVFLRGRAGFFSPVKSALNVPGWDISFPGMKRVRLKIQPINRGAIMTETDNVSFIFSLFLYIAILDRRGKTD